MNDSTKVGKWLLAEGPHSDIVISSRIRLARNIKGINFLTRATRLEQERVLNLVREALEERGFLKDGRFLERQELTPLKLEFLLERHLISFDFIISRLHRGLYLNRDETLSTLINEEDHLRLQALASGLNLFTAYEQIEGLDDALGQSLSYAYERDLGFLTACPTNVGTGMRASFFIHLPGLVFTKEIEKLLRSLLEMGLIARGIYGEGTETKGNLFQISNQITLGLSETEILEKVTKIGEEVLSYEKRARETLMKRLRQTIEDKIFRSYAILKNARLLTSEEAINILLMVRLGINLGMIKDITLSQINTLLILTKPANLQIYYNQEMTPQERDEKRADLVRSFLKGEAVNG